MRRNIFQLIILIAFASFVIAGWDFLIGQTRQSTQLVAVSGDYVRLHVVANSDSELDQHLKLQVRDAVISYLTPHLSNVKNISHARQIIRDHKAGVLSEAQKAVNDGGHNYEIQLETGIFQFPLKTYGELTLPSGEYEAVRIKIGQAKGSNWWCVLFPPLCFINGTQTTAISALSRQEKEDYNNNPVEIKFRWKIAEWWNNKNE